MRVPAIVTLLTDFGLSDAFVGIMKGVLLTIARDCRVVDLTHAIAPQNILAGALQLRSAVPFFPDGTIHVAVVDPGVGGTRRALVVETERGLLLGPDNGLLSPAAKLLGVRQIYELQPGQHTLGTISHTFHGRDVFAATAGHLARGLSAAACGPRVDSMQELAVPIARREGERILGEVVHIDHFGNLVTNIEASLVARFSGSELSVRVGGTDIVGIAHSYGAVAEGCPLAIVASWGTLEVAVRNGNAAKRLGASVGAAVRVEEKARRQ